MKTVSPSFYVGSALAGMLLAVMLLSSIYVAGYFLLQNNRGLYAAEWQFKMYEPAVRAERWATGKPVDTGFVDSKGHLHNLRLR